MFLTHKLAPPTGAVTVLLSVWVFTLGEAQAAVPAEDPPLRYRVERIDLSVEGPIEVGGLNNRGDVVLNTRSASGGSFVEPFVYSQGRVTSYGDRFREVFAISDRGDLVGRGPAGASSWLLRAGRLTALPGTLLSISPNGDWLAGSAPSSTGRPTAFVFDGVQGRFLDVPGALFESEGRAVNDHGAVAGMFYRNENRVNFGFVYEGQQATALPTFCSDCDVLPFALNNAGQTVGLAVSPSRVTVGFRYSEGVMTNLNDFLSMDINDRGWMVSMRGEVFRDGAVHELNSLIPAADRSRWNLTTASFLNDAGQVAGIGLFDGVSTPYLLTPVPEPGTTALLLAGLGVVGWVCRRRGQVTVA